MMNLSKTLEIMSIDGIWMENSVLNFHKSKDFMHELLNLSEWTPVTVELTLLGLKQDYSGAAKSIPQLLMSWQGKKAWVVYFTEIGTWW